MNDSLGKIPFILLTGFLGSGKTTFLLNLIQNNGHQYKIAVIQNEFAPGNIDGRIIRSQFENIPLLEINNGSVFCVCLLSDFMDKASRFIAEYQPDIIVLEASGLSDPLSITEILQQAPLCRYSFLSKIWTIVDAVNYEKLSKFQTTVKNQVRIAHEVIINKIDLNRAAVHRIEEHVRNINPQANIHKTSFARIDVSLALEDHSLSQQLDSSEFRPGSRPDIQLAVYKSGRVLIRFDIDQLVQMLDEAKVIRAKGYLRISERETVAIQYSQGQVEYQAMQDQTGRSELIALGGDINPRKLSQMIRNAQILNEVNE